MGKKKELPFKKGMKVAYLTSYGGRIHVNEAVVTLVTNRDGAPVVHVRSPDSWQGFYKRSFSTVCGQFQENPYPIWQLIPLEGKDIANLKKRAEKASRLYQEYERKCEAIRSKVDAEAKQWAYDECRRRIADVPNGPDFRMNVIARLGFKRPKSIKVKSNGGTRTVNLS